MFYCVIFLLPFEELTSLGGMSITKWVGLLFFFVSLADRKALYGSIPRVFIAFFLFIGIGMSIDIFSFPLELDSLNELVRPLLMVILMIVTYNLSLNKKSGRIVTAIFLSSLACAIAELFELGTAYVRVNSEVVHGATLDRVAALGGDENFMACYIALCVLAGIIYGFNIIPTRWRYRILALAGAVIGFGAIIKTSSRGGMLACVVGISCIVLTRAELTKKIKYGVFVLLLLSAMGIMVMENPLFEARILSSVETMDSADRIMIWEQAVRLSIDSPVYGFGYKMYEFELGKALGHRLKASHNLFLSVLLSSGFIGLCFFLYFYFRSFKTIWLHKLEGVNVILFPWFMVALTAGLTLNIEITKWFWIIVAMSLGAGQHPQQPAPAPEILTVTRASGPQSLVLPGAASGFANLRRQDGAPARDPRMPFPTGSA